ncbi:DUF1801 domain-containing protein [Vallitalea okinawensis]|uniref:DUF1801 domain-containing protein n=1 Tax=Vallitalea okinawensis TaxID=2078660 RepID=UPI000CFB09B0|nr:DUF1801 domain-containing protein [Vallitalea okinawensis]
MKKRSQEVTEYIAKYDSEKIKRLEIIRTLIHDSVSEIDEKMWTKVPCFYTDDFSIVIRVFGDHMNFIADTVVQYKDELLDYKITPKGMLQIFDNQELPLDTLKKIICSCHQSN